MAMGFIELESKEILSISISKERNMFVAERFLSDIVNEYREHPISTDGGTRYPQACKFLELNHHIHSFLEKSIIERTCNISKIEPKPLTIIFIARGGTSAN